MKKLRCEGCGVDYPMNDMFTVMGKALCQPCGDKELAGYPSDRIPEGAVLRQSDPTICAKCGQDNVTRELPRVAGMPVCETCRDTLIRRPYPTWVKVSFLAMLLLAGIEFTRNWRLFQAYVEIPRAEKALEKGDIKKAADLMGRAARHLPERPELAAQAGFLQGLSLYQDGRFAEAKVKFKEARKSAPGQEGEAVDHWIMAAEVADLMDQNRSAEAIPVAEAFCLRHPQDKGAASMLRDAKIGAAFDEKNYDRFLVLSREEEKLAPDDFQTLAQVASALACRYAVTGEESYRQECMAQLDKARKAAADAPRFKEYEERILHRLQSREIIDRKEYNRRFRSGAEGGKH